MADINPVVIAGSIDESKLIEAIDKLVNEVDQKVGNMATKFEGSISRMNEAMQGFARNQALLASGMKGTWDDMIASFEQMRQAQENVPTTTRNENKKEKEKYEENTVGGLKQLIKEEKKRQDTMVLETEELKKQNREIDNLKTKLRNETSPKRTITEVLGMDERSIDQINKKIRELKRVEIDPKDAAAAANVQKEYQRLIEKKNQLLGVNTKLEKSNRALASAFNYLRNRIIFAFTIGTMTSFVKDLIHIRAEYELLDRSIGILVGDMEKGTQIFNELSEMALKSPFTLVELGTAAKQLSAYNFAASEVVDTTRRLADISAALGVPMERLVYNLGQIKAQNVLNARDARDFANAGLAIVPMLAKMYTEQKRFGNEIVTTAKVYDMMKKKLVTYADVMNVIEDATNEGGKFFDFQARQADTLKVQYANLTLAYNNMLNEMGTEYQDVLSAPVKVMKTIFANWKEIERIMKTVIVLVGVYKAAMLLSGTLTFLKAMSTTWISIVKEIRSAKDAMVAFNLITNMNPLGLLVAGLSALTAYLVFFKNETKQVSAEMHMFGEEGSRLITRVNMLQKALAASNSTSGLYKKSLQELTTIMNDYGIELDAESATRDEVNKKIQQTIELIKEESSARSYANSIAKAERTYEEGIEEARRKFEERLQGAMTDSLLVSDNKELQNNAQLIADVYANVLEQNMHLIVGKTGKEYQKGVDEIMKQLHDAGRKIGLSEATLSKQWLSDELFVHRDIFTEFFQSVREQGEIFDTVTKQIEGYYEAAKKVQESNMTDKEKMDAYSRVLRTLSTDAKQFYDRVYDIAELAKTKYTIDIELNTVAKNIPDELLKKSPDELRNIAIQYASALNFGLKQKGGEPLSKQLEYMMQVTAAYRRVMEDAERNDVPTPKGAKKDVLGEALSKEIQLVNEMKKRYDEYRKMGISTTEAQANATDEYGKSLNAVSKTLAKFGIQTKLNDELMVSDLRGLKEYYTYLLNMATKLGNTKGMEAIEKAIANINVEIAKVDMKKITDGLNNELSKVKDEYELAVELDATEGLGDALMEMLNIDASDFPRTIQEYMDRANKMFDEFRLKTHTWISPMDVFKMSEQDMRNWGTAMGFDENYVKNLVSWIGQAQGVVDKWVKDTIKQNNTMEYELGTNADKIAKKEKEIADLRAKLSNNLTDIERNNTELRIRKEEEELAKLQAELLNSIPAYAALYQSIAEHSDNMTRRLTQNMLDILEDAKNNVRDGGLFAIMYGGNEVTRMSQKELDRLIEKITKDAKKVQAPFDKIKEAFTEGDDKVIDFAKGVEYLSQEVKKLSDLVNTIGNVAEAMGLSEETTEVIRDISKSLDGLSTMQTGISQIMNKDYISGITSLAGGLLNAMSAWFDNSDNNITRQIKDSELAVKRLELAYKQLEKAVNDAIGTAVVGAEKMALANKTLQLAEVERQLTLEKTRTGKNRDEERIISLQSQYEDLKNEIKDGYKEIVTNLLGISSVGSAVENMVGGVINALRNGENAIDSWNSSIDDMIVNMIMKFVSAKVVAPLFQSVIDDITEDVAKRGDAAKLEAQSLKQQRDSLNAQLDEYRALQEKNNKSGKQGYARMYGEVVAQLESQIAELDKQILDAEERAARDTEFTADDLDYMVGELVALKGQGQATIDAVLTVLNKYGLGSSSTQSQLSALQQGIQGVTETTASAVEAYLNSVLDQMFVQVGIQSRMLLELQNSYQMQAAIHAILTGVVTANGMAFRVEMQ